MSHHGGIEFNDIFREVVDGSMACIEDLLNPNFYETSQELGLLITCHIFEMSFSDILRAFIQNFCIILASNSPFD